MFINGLFIIVYFLNLMLETNEYIFVKIKKLSSDKYFAILDTGLFIFYNNFTINESILSFTSSQKININDNFINIIISEFEDKGSMHIFCLIKKNLFIYNDSNNTTKIYALTQLNENEYSKKGVIYNLIPYKYENNNYYFIISLMNDQLGSQKIFFLCYNIDVLTGNVDCQAKKYVGKDFLFGLSDLSAFFHNCQISLSNNILRCFFLRDYSSRLCSIDVNLDSNDIQKDANKIEIINIEDISTIKSSISLKNDNFACFLVKNSYSYCIIDESYNKFNQIYCANQYNCEDIETYFFKETNEFAYICKKKNIFKLIIFNSDDKKKILNSNCDQLNITNKIIIVDECQNINTYSLIYNNGYHLITECNFPNSYLNSSNNSFSILQEDKYNLDYEEKSNSSLEIMLENKLYLDFIKEIANSTIEILIENKLNLDYYKEITNNSLKTMFENRYNIDINNEVLITFFSNLPKEQINQYFNLLIKILPFNENTEIKGNNSVIRATPINSTYFQNGTRINMSECEKILRNYYNIPDSSGLMIIQIETEDDNINSLFNKLDYTVYDENRRELNLSLCKDSNIQIFREMKGNTPFDISLFDNFKKMGVNILNPKDSFFNDICYPYSQSGDDLILQDRRDDIFQNYSVCEKNCKLNDINVEDRTIICDCKGKDISTNEEINNNDDKFEEISLLDSNIGVLKCYQLVFSFDGKKNNIGFLIFTISLLINFIILFFYFYNGIKPTIKYIFNEMIKYGYLGKNHENFFEVKKIFNPKKIDKKKINIKNKRKKKIMKINFKNDNSDSKSEHILKGKNKKLMSKSEIKANKKKQLKGKKKIKVKKMKKILALPTEDIKNKEIIKETKKYNSAYYGIIKINILHMKKYNPKDSNQTLHNYTFQEAIRYDKRSIFKIFYIYLLSKQIIFHTFFQKTPLELFPIRLSLFIFMILTDLALNALLYLNDNISKKYRYTKNLFLFAFSDNITVIIYSTLLCFVLMSLFSRLITSTSSIRKVFEEEEKKMKEDKRFEINDNEKEVIFTKIEKLLKRLKIKIIIFIILELILLLFFCYYVTAFCHVYASTQISWLWDSILSLLSRTVIELLFSLLFAKLYIISVESNFYSLYRILLFLYDL